ncbi:MAG: hypothetical protein WD795_10025 [Woeseia sp.]
MLRYMSRRHKTLMDESEQALWTAAQKESGTDARIAKQIIGDAKTHGLWEALHAELVRPVAEHNGRAPQVIALRDLEVRLVHRRALIDHIREHQLRGKDRERLFQVFYGPREFEGAVLAEHRQYMLAVSSRVSADHLINVMSDPLSKKLLEEYEALYTRYFELYCYVVGSEDRDSAEATKHLMTEARQQTERVRRRINTERPDNRAADFERQAVLARSGRYPILDYMVG